MDVELMEGQRRTCWMEGVIRKGLAAAQTSEIIIIFLFLFFSFNSTSRTTSRGYTFFSLLLGCSTLLQRHLLYATLSQWDSQRNTPQMPISNLIYLNPCMSSKWIVCSNHAPSKAKHLQELAKEYPMGV